MRSTALLACIILAQGSSLLRGEFLNFESAHVRPLALSPDAGHLFAVNTPDNRVAVFRITSDGLELASEVVVGLEPVAIQARSSGEIWVVNHLSDSVSVVDVSDPRRPFVRETIAVGDAPCDIVFAASDRNKAFITTAHRGQSRPGDPQLTTPGIGRADVWVLDANDTSRPPHIITLFCDTPRALAVSADGLSVYAAAFHSGNRTTALHELEVRQDPEVNARINDGFLAPGMPPLPEGLANTTGVEPPETAIIVRHDGEAWRDEAGRDWSPRVRFDLPDKDVFRIDASADPPVEAGFAAGVGSVIYNLAVHPTNGRVYASNQESLNHVRFEPRLRGAFVRSRVSIIDFGAAGAAAVDPVHLNPHIDYSVPSGPTEETERSLGIPLAMEFTSGGEALYVAAFGSRRVAVLDAAGAVVDRIRVGGGPSGLALDEARGHLYVLNRWDHTISIVDTLERRERMTIPLGFSPEPDALRAGRRLLYDTALSSGHGDAACASCHIFASFDSLAWDLGDPSGRISSNPTSKGTLLLPLRPFHPMKGPMTTQSLRGLAAAGAMHWRGDRNGALAGKPVFDERASFLTFRPAFQSLLGRETELPVDAMESLADFVLSLRYPPNPIANLDGTKTAEQLAGQEIFLSNGDRNGLGGDGLSCSHSTCHGGPLGTSGGGQNQLLESQDLKVPHLRNLYEKLGRFGSALPRVVQSPLATEPAPTPHAGDQVRGFGFHHDGAVGTLFEFFRGAGILQVSGLSAPIGTPAEPFQLLDRPGRSGDRKARELEAFLLAFDTGLRPHVGQQMTLRSANVDASASMSRLGIVRRAGADPVATGLLHGRMRGFVLARSPSPGSWVSDRRGERYTEDELLAAIRADPDAAITFTAAPPGCGERIGVDRDSDGYFDGDEIDLGSDPADAASTPMPPAPVVLAATCAADGVELAWSPFASSAFDIEGYNVYRSADAASLGVLVNAEPIAETSHLDLDATPGTRWYRVTALAGGRESAPSSAVAAEPCPPAFRRGDCNDDGGVDLSDAIATLAALFLGASSPGCDDACDSNDDGTVDLSDAIATLGALFLGNPSLPRPGMTDCGVDPTEDEAQCRTTGQCSR